MEDFTPNGLYFVVCYTDESFELPIINSVVFLKTEICQGEKFWVFQDAESFYDIEPLASRLPIQDGPIVQQFNLNKGNLGMVMTNMELSDVLSNLG